MLTGCGNITETSKNADLPSIISSVVVNTTVTKGGQFPDTLCVSLESEPSGPVQASDFLMEGWASNWMDPKLHSFTAAFSEVILEGNQLTLTFSDFKDKYFFVDNWTVTNAALPELSFSSDKITRIITPVADKFESFTKKDGEDFNYHLFTPKNTSCPQPIVIVFHGFADTHNLLAYRTSIAWAEDDAQKERPCYVLSPTIDDETYFTGDGRAAVFEKVYEKVQSMIQEGKVDPSRVYIMGNSFGGMSTIEFMEKYPDLAAGALALCSAVNYSETAVANLHQLPDIPVWFCHAEHDSTIPSENSKNMFRILTDLGRNQIHLTIYSDEEMNAAGGSSDPDSTFSYHHVEMAVMEDPAYAEWLFAQHR